ncbi:DNA cytosine methyltransferase, partial [Aliarcobacter skirrowii]|uniref:DNA cytosine methyltransferase n=1 Tax=Aliarcobacter skirrowii TaxID=28200 RepID=UPI0029BC895F
YPKTEMIVGDITNKKIFNEIIKKAKEIGIDFIIATPPCQGMSSAGKQDKDDIRNHLITYAIEIIKILKPKFVFLENVPQQLKTSIRYNNKKVLIPDYLKEELSSNYYFNKNQTIDSSDYGVPQSRIRSIFLLSNKEINFIWEHPEKEKKKKTLKEAIGDLPSLDPLIYDVTKKEQLELFPDYEKKKKEGLKVSKWHYPPKHVYRQVFAMIHTPTGKSAFENEDKYKPLTKEGKIVKGFKNTYKRQNWDKPGYTITMYNRTIGSQENVHPGRLLDNNKYSDPRVLTILELLRITSLPDDWNIPDWASEHFIRQVIGEGIPPLLVKKIFEKIGNL